MGIVEKIENLDPPGRFLIYDPDRFCSSVWIPVESKEMAVGKVMHRLREREKVGRKDSDVEFVSMINMTAPMLPQQQHQQQHRWSEEYTTFLQNVQQPIGNDYLIGQAGGLQSFSSHPTTDHQLARAHVQQTLASKEAQSSRSKLVLPNLTTAVQEDMHLLKESAERTTSKPLSIGSRPEFADYQLVDITTPHPNGE